MSPTPPDDIWDLYSSIYILCVYLVFTVVYITYKLTEALVLVTSSLE